MEKKELMERHFLMVKFYREKMNSAKSDEEKKECVLRRASHMKEYVKLQKEIREEILV